MTGTRDLQRHKRITTQLFSMLLQVVNILCEIEGTNLQVLSLVYNIGIYCVAFISFLFFHHHHDDVLLAVDYSRTTLVFIIHTRGVKYILRYQRGTVKLANWIIIITARALSMCNKQMLYYALQLILYVVYKNTFFFPPSLCTTTV